MFARTRIAPTPSGFLHEGNAVSFLFTWAQARRHGARVLLRVDDLDQPRVRREYLQDIFDTLAWLQLDYDEGPTSVDDLTTQWSQVRRLPLYRNLLEDLRASGQLYGCTCSRTTMRNRSDTFECPCQAEGRDMDQEGVAWKVKVPPGTTVRYREADQHRVLDLSHLMGPFVVRQKNGLPAYQVASLADDTHFNVDLIVRGEDLLPSTAAQLYLAELLGYSPFKEATFIHHPLVRDAAGNKLSKSAGARALKSWREQGLPVQPLLHHVARLLNIEQPVSRASDLWARSPSGQWNTGKQ